MKAQQRIFFDFLQFCISAVTEIPASVKDAEWKMMYAIAKKQALLGVCFMASVSCRRFWLQTPTC